MNRKLFVSCLVALVLLFFSAGSQHTSLAVPSSSPSQANEETFEVSWDISVKHFRDESTADNTNWERQQIHIEGSATVHVPHDGKPSRALPFVLTETDDYEQVISDSCRSYHRTALIQDPDRYSGGPDRFWVNPYVWLTAHQQGTQWYMTNPLHDNSWDIAPDNSMRTFTYHIVETNVSCVPAENYSNEWTLQLEPLIPPPPGPNGWAAFNVLNSSDGKTFALDLTYDADDWTHVDYHVNIHKLGSCEKQASPIDISNPAIDDLHVQAEVSPGTIPPNKGDTLQPPDPAVLTVSVTCEGVPVKNAGVKVAVKAKDKSGGHVHTAGPNPRPRGYLRGPGQANFTQITDKVPSITVLTDSTGRAKIDFRPGTDYNTGGASNCAGNQRGIAGTYEITSTLTDSRFKYRKATLDIEVKRTDFVELHGGSNYVIQYNSSVHPQGTWGTLATTNAIPLVANDFYNAQVKHNHELTTATPPKEAWPIVPLGILDISLKDGGLFETGGVNVCAPGQPTTKFSPWEIPHQTHLKGNGVDIATSFWNDGTAAGWKRFIWWRNTLRAVGCNYGLWARERTFHLNVDQDAASWGTYHAGCSKTYQIEKPGLLQADPLAPHLRTTVAPDLFALVEPQFMGDEPLFPAPGQQVSFTLSVNNLLGTADAHSVELTATLPAGLIFVSATPAPSRMVSASQPVWDMGGFAAGAVPQVIDMITQVDSGVSAGASLTVTAQVSGAEADAIDDNNVAVGGVDIMPPGADLALDTEGLLGAAMTVGRDVTFTLDVLNHGNMTAANTTLTLTLPASVTLVSAVPAPSSAVPSRASWQLGNIAPEESAEVTVTVYLSPALGAAALSSPTEESSALTYTLQVSTNSYDFDSSNNVQNIVMSVEFAGPDLSANLRATSASGGALSAGQDVTYTVLYGNYGNQIAPTTTLALSLWSGMRLVSAEPAPSRAITSSTFLGGVLGWDIGDLSVGDSGEIHVRVHVADIAPEGSMVLAAISSNAMDIQPTDNVDVRIESRKSCAVYLPLVMVSSHGGSAPTATATPTPPPNATSTPTPTATAGTPHPLLPGFGLRQFTAMMTATPAAP